MTIINEFFKDVLCMLHNFARFFDVQPPPDTPLGNRIIAFPPAKAAALATFCAY